MNDINESILQASKDAEMVLADIVNIKNQIEKAMPNSDNKEVADWLVRARCALRIKGREHQKHLLKVSKLRSMGKIAQQNKKGTKIITKKRRPDSLERAFVDIAKNELPIDTFNLIMNKAKDRLLDSEVN